MKPRFACFSIALAAGLFGAGCTETRSISNSGYSGSDGRYSFDQELTEADVLGLPQKREITNADIRAALASSSTIQLLRGKPLVVVQSGAHTPETEMLRQLERYYKVVPFEGTKNSKGGEDYAAKLRLAAAQGGCPRVLVYWGTLESERVDHGTKAVSWVPIAGSFVPDESQQMRLRMKGAIIDVASGHWTMVTSQEIADKSLSAGFIRERMDQGQVKRLKAAGYSKFVDQLARDHTR